MNWKHIYAFVQVSIIVFGFVLFGYWYFLDGDVVNKPLTDMTDTLNIKVDKSSYKIGDPVIVSNAFCKHRSILATTALQIVDGQIITMVAHQNNLPIGCYGVSKPFLSQATIIPKGIAAGTWHLEWTVTYEVNPIKTITYKRRSVDFQIVNDLETTKQIIEQVKENTRDIKSLQ